jgi:CoA:oxalate CoA-transferase
MEQLGQPIRTGPTLPRPAPFGLFSCIDGHVALLAPQDRMVHSFLEAIGRSDLLEDPSFATRDGRVMQPRAIEWLIEDWTAGRTVGDVMGVLSPTRAPIGLRPRR